MAHVDGWVGIKNFTKHQSTSEKVQKGIESAKRLVPSHILEKFDTISIPPDRVSIPSPVLKHKHKSELKLKLEPETDTLPTPAQEAKRFFEERESNDIFKAIVSSLVEKKIPELTAQNELKKFILYWTEKNTTGTKEKWQLRETFEVKRRISQWLGRAGSASAARQPADRLDDRHRPGAGLFPFTHRSGSRFHLGRHRRRKTVLA